MFACFFETNFPNIPFSKPTCFHFGCSVCFCWFCLCFHMFCFCFSVLCWLWFWYVFLLLFCVCFVYCFFADYESIDFPAILVFFESCWLECSLFYALVFCCCFFLYFCFCFHSKQRSCIASCLCCLLSFLCNKTKWFLVCISLSCLNFLLALFSIFVYRSHTPRRKGKNRHSKKENMQKKGTSFFQLAQLCSQIVFLILGVALKNVNFCLLKTL